MIRIVQQGLVRRPYDGIGGIASIDIREAADDAKLKKLCLRGVPRWAYVVDMDAATCSHRSPTHRFPQLSAHVCRTLPAVNKVCDAALVEEDDDIIRIALLDLKSCKPKFSEARDQLVNTQLFIDYLMSVIRWRHGEPRRVHTGKHLVMTGQAKNPVGRRVQAVAREDVFVHTVTVDSKGRSYARWGDFFAG